MFVLHVETVLSSTLIATVWLVHSRSMQILTLSDLRGPTGGGAGVLLGFPICAPYHKHNSLNMFCLKENVLNWMLETGVNDLK